MFRLPHSRGEAFFNSMGYAILKGGLAGALFGVLFGAMASVFHNGPTLMQGIQESWWWFALAGAFMSVGLHRARKQDDSPQSHA